MRCLEDFAGLPQVVVASFEAFFVDRIVRRPHTERLSEFFLRFLQVCGEFRYNAAAEIGVVDRTDCIEERGQPSLVLTQVEDLFKPVELYIEQQIGNLLLQLLDRDGLLQPLQGSDGNIAIELQQRVFCAVEVGSARACPLHPAAERLESRDVLDQQGDFHHQRRSLIAPAGNIAHRAEPARELLLHLQQKPAGELLQQLNILFHVRVVAQPPDDVGQAFDEQPAFDWHQPGCQGAEVKSAARIAQRYHELDLGHDFFEGVRSRLVKRLEHAEHFSPDVLEGLGVDVTLVERNVRFGTEIFELLECRDALDDGAGARQPQTAQERPDVFVAAPTADFVVAALFAFLPILDVEVARTMGNQNSVRQP